MRVGVTPTAINSVANVLIKGCGNSYSSNSFGNMDVVSNGLKGSITLSSDIAACNSFPGVATISGDTIEFDAEIKK